MCEVCPAACRLGSGLQAFAQFYALEYEGPEPPGVEINVCESRKESLGSEYVNFRVDYAGLPRLCRMELKPLERIDQKVL